MEPKYLVCILRTGIYHTACEVPQELWCAMVSGFTGQKGSGMLKIKAKIKSQEKRNMISNKYKQMLQRFNQFSTKDGVIRKGKKCSCKILTFNSFANIWVQEVLENVSEMIFSVISNQCKVTNNTVSSDTVLKLLKGKSLPGLVRRVSVLCGTLFEQASFIT